MLGKEIRKLNMLGLLINICEDHAALIANNKAFAKGYETLKAAYNNILATAEAQGKVLTGIAADKNVDKENAIQAGLVLANNLEAYANEQKNNTLQDQAHVTYSDLTRLAGLSLIPKLKDIHKLVSDNLALLADANITNAHLDDYNAKIEQCRKSLLAPRGAVANKSTTTDALGLLVKEAMDIERNSVYKRLGNFSGTNADFVALYKSSRKVIRGGTGTRKKDKPDENGKTE